MNTNPSITRKPAEAAIWWPQRKSGQVVPVELTIAGIGLTLYIAAGTLPGPVLAVLGCVHGDEYEGPMTIARLLADLPVADMAGTLIALPVTNPPAFHNDSRLSPLDGLNLARCFPGKPDGQPSEQLAWLVANEVIAPCDSLVDLHSAGKTFIMALLAGYVNLGDEHGRQSRAMAEAFGAPVLWEHPETGPGRTLSTALDLGIPCMYTEAPGGGCADPATVKCYLEGVRRVMAHHGMMEGDASPRHTSFWHGAGNTDEAMEALHPGLFNSRVAVGDKVEAGALLGEIIDFDGKVLQEFVAPTARIVALTRRTTRVTVGDGLYLLTAVGDS